MKFESTSFGSITIDGKKYAHDVYLLNGGKKIEQRDKSHSPRIRFHRSLSKWELEKLLGNNPEYLIIGTGQRGVLPLQKKTEKWLEKELKNKEICLIKDLTPNVLEKVNELLEKGVKVAGVFHTTC